MTPFLFLFLLSLASLSCNDKESVRWSYPLLSSGGVVRFWDFDVSGGLSAQNFTCIFTIFFTPEFPRHHKDGVWTLMHGHFCMWPVDPELQDGVF